MEDELQTQFLASQWTQSFTSHDASPTPPAPGWIRLCENYHYPAYAFIHYLWGVPKDAMPYSEIGLGLAPSKGGTKSTISRLRCRYQKLFRTAIANRIDDLEAVEEENCYLMHLIAPTHHVA